MSTIKEVFPWDTILTTPTAHIRSKRDLFDLGGRILGNVSGLATNNDVKQTKETVNTWTDVVNAQAKVLEGHNKVIQTVVDSQHVMGTKIDLLTRMATKLKTSTLYFHQLVIISEKLLAIYSSVDHLRQAFHQRFNLLSAVSSGIVTPDSVI